MSNENNVNTTTTDAAAQLKAMECRLDGLAAMAEKFLAQLDLDLAQPPAAPVAPAQPPAAPVADDYIRNQMAAILGNEERRKAFTSGLTLDNLEASERAAAAAIDDRLWAENKTGWLWRKTKQHGPGLLAGAAVGAGGVLAVQRYQASVDSVGLDDSVIPMAGGGLK